MQNITASIIQKLTDIESSENIRIIHACESGSRAWGFESADSDYDVRFVYIRPLEYYLGLEEKKDVLESELNEVYDIVGWDVTKVLRLLTKSNPTVFEWAGSPVVYKTTSEWEKILAVLPHYFQSEKMLHHYLSMAKSNIRNYFEGPEVILKKYLYILRPVLACQWILSKDCAPPTAFTTLADAVLPESLSSSLQKLLDAKRNATEKDTGPHIPNLDHYIAEKIAEVEENLKAARNQNPDAATSSHWDQVNKVFKELVM